MDPPPLPAAIGRPPTGGDERGEGDESGRTAEGEDEAPPPVPVGEAKPCCDLGLPLGSETVRGLPTVRPPDRPPMTCTCPPTATAARLSSGRGSIEGSGSTHLPALMIKNEFLVGNLTT